MLSDNTTHRRRLRTTSCFWEHGRKITVLKARAAWEILAVNDLDDEIHAIGRSATE